jgi:hypothetical protein
VNVSRQRFQLAVLAVLAMDCGAGTVTDTATQSVSITLSSAAKVSVPASVTLTTVGATFQSYTGTEVASYKVRTTQSGSATLTVRGTSEFSPASGPSIASSDLTYTCASAGIGTACSGTQTVSTSAQTPVVSVGASACVGTGCVCASPATISLGFGLANKPQFHTGSYSAQLTFTISAL